MMARAFDDDPVMAWLFPDLEQRRRQLPKFFAITFRELSFRHEARVGQARAALFVDG